MKIFKKYFALILSFVILNLVLCIRTNKGIFAEETLPSNIDVVFSQGNIPNNENSLFDDITISNVTITTEETLIVPGTNFNSIVSGKINSYYDNNDRKLDVETFYFDINGTNYAYTFTGWHVVGSDTYLPEKTVFQPGDLIFKDTLETYAKDGKLELEAVWGKCYFIKNPYTVMKYKEVVNEGWILDEAESLKLSELSQPLSSDSNTGRTPNDSFATIEGLYELLRKERYTNKTHSKIDAYSTVIMLAGDTNYVKDTNGKYKNASGTWTAISAIYGQKITNNSQRFISVTYKSLQDKGSSYNYVYKPKGYYNQVYGNVRFDNVNFISLPKNDLGGQTVGTEFQLYTDQSTINYFETTARYNRSVPSGRSEAIGTFRPHNFDIVVFNSGKVNSIQTTWQTDIKTPNKTIEWFIGRNANVSSNVHCGIAAAYESTVAVIDVNFILTVSGGSIDSIYGASKGVNATSRGKREINIIGDGSSKNGQYNPKVNNIYGGAHQSKFYGDVYLNIKNANQITNVYGGGNEYTATTYGNININIVNSIIKGDIYGGGKNANSEKNSSGYGGDVNLNIDNSHVQGNIYGSGMGMTQTIELADTILTYTDNSKWYDKTLYPNGLYPEGWEYPIGYDKFGNVDVDDKYFYPKYDPTTGYVNIGGYKSISWTDNSATSISFKHTLIMAYLSLATVENVEININNSTIGTSTNNKGNIYGGGSIARVLGNTKINISGNKTIIYGSVFGGGDGESVPGNVTVYKPLEPSTYTYPKYSIDAYNVSGIPTKVSMPSQSPDYKTSSYGVFKWSNDESLLTSDTPGVDIENKLLYSPNTIGLGKVLGNTNVNISDAKIHGDVYGGGNNGIVEGNTYVEVSGTINVENIYAGCNKADVNGETKVVIKGGTIINVYGGNNLTGVITGNLYSSIDGGTVENVYGGGNLADSTTSTYITVNSGNIDNVYGGGKEAIVNEVNILVNNTIKIEKLYGGGYVGDITTNTNIEVKNGQITDIYGGGYSGHILGNTEINIDYGTFENIYGGGFQGNISGNTNITTNDGEYLYIYGGGYAGIVSGDIDIDITNGIYSNIYGGGFRGDVSGDTDITVNNGTLNRIYGGGYAGHIQGNTNISVNGGTVKENVYGGGFQGNVNSSVNLNISNAHIIGSIYGGGENGDILDSTNIRINKGIIDGNVYGGGYAGNVTNICNIIINAGNIKNSVYGGGYAGTAYDTSVLIDETDIDTRSSEVNILIEGNVFGGGEGESATVFNKTSTVIDMNLSTTVTEQLLSTDKISGKTETTVVFVEGYSRILGNVYGGGDLAQVGQGIINTGNNTATISEKGNTYVEVRNGYVGGSVFGGGSGIPKAGQQYDLYMGTIFGNTLVNLYGGYIGGNVYGGGTQSRLYKDNNDQNNVATLNIIEDTNNIIINGSVFGGGDRGNSATTNASVATTIGNVEININNNSNASSRIYFLTGGVYGDGNLCLVNGKRTVNMKNFTTGNEYLKTFYSLQRADVVNLDNCDIVLLGAIDLVEEGDTTIYSINRIKNINMYNGSTIKLDQIVKNLENIYSDQESDRKFIINGNNGSNSVDKPDELDPLTNEEIANYITNEFNKNIICVANGLYLELMKENNEYGSVKGLFTLQLLRANYGEGGGFVYASLTESTGDFICFTKFSEDGDYMLVVDDRGGFINDSYSYYCWFIQGNLINYSISINGYIGSEETSYIETAIIPTHDVPLYYVLNNLVVDEQSVLYNAIVGNKYELVGKNTNLVGQEIAIEMILGSNSWFLEYDNVNKIWSFGGKLGAHNISEELRHNILAENVTINSYASQVQIVLHKSLDVNAEVTNMQFSLEMLKYMDDPNKDDNIIAYDETYQLNFKIGFSIVRLVPVQNSYYGPYSNYAGLASSNAISITTSSTMTFEYQTRFIPSAFPISSGNMIWALSTNTYSYYIDSLGNFMTLDSSGNVVAISTTLTLDPSETTKILVSKTTSGDYQYVHDGKTITFEQMTVAQVSYIPKGTKITMIDMTLSDSPGYYYYICEENTNYINLLDFMKMGTNITIKNNIKPEFVKQYETGQASRITERIIFVFDFETTEFSSVGEFQSSIYLCHSYGKDDSYIDIMDYVKAEVNFENTTYTRSYPKVVEYSVSTNKLEDGIGNFELSFEFDEYYDDELAKIVVNIEEDDIWTNTNLLEGKFGIKIESIVENGKLPDGIQFIYKDKIYYPQSKNKYVIIPLNGFGDNDIYVNNILGTIRTTLDAEFSASLVVLPDVQYLNNNLSNVDTLIDSTIKCEIIERDKGALKVEVNNPILSSSDSLSLKVYLRGATNYVSTKIYYKENGEYVLLDVTLPEIQAVYSGTSYNIPLTNLNLEKGAYKIIFSNGVNEELINIIIK